ncbi:DUF3426 domain-containing protein [Pseudothauera nasutitermitis]|uniref:DUF3426 domain-containing protein n=1 Tax=Pseudothauera nasutitermitis TaxID=2565930 RepID=A0A4V3WB50_9RHOO|nr:DUF3426 domain-containing protein [Pseudothauera nasutitermitis]THF61922.1 DUF3426 domain-containing protein [Pseudothauera nasutitermitis]
MMFARCPACQTVFRVRPEQLRARRGEVRCGHCFNPFNALEHLLTDAESAAAAAGAAQPSGAQAAPSTPAPAVETAAPAAPQASPVVPPSAAPETPAPAAAEQPPASSVHENPALDFEIPEVWRSPRERLKASTAETSPSPEPSAPAAPWPALDADKPVEFQAAQPEEIPEPPDTLPTPDFAPSSARRHGADADAPLPDIQSSFSAALAQAGRGRIEPGARQESTPSPDPQHAPLPAWTEETHADAPPPAATDAAAEADDDTDAEHQLARLDQRYGPAPGTAEPRRWLAGLGVGVLLGALAAQSAYLFRQEITRALPSLRPLYLAACQTFGCTLPLPQDSERIGIVNSELQSDPRVPGRYILHASVRNNAPYPQAWPQLELTLTDTADRPVARRVLAPQEWAHAETAKLRAGFPAGRDQTVELHFDAPEVAPTGYRLYIFYP